MRPLEGLDDIDRKLLALLQANDRLALAELAKETSSSPSTIANRIKRLTLIGVITGFHARVAAETVGLELLAFVLVALSGSKVEQAFIKKIEEIPSVLECHCVTGEWNYLVKLRVKTVRELEAFVTATVKSIPGVERTNAIVALSSTKEAWTIPLT